MLTSSSLGFLLIRNLIKLLDLFSPLINPPHLNHNRTPRHLLLPYRNLYIRNGLQHRTLPVTLIPNDRNTGHTDWLPIEHLPHLIKRLQHRLDLSIKSQLHI